MVFAEAYLAYGESMGSKERYVVYDFHRSYMAITPYLGMKVEEINKISTNEVGRIGMAIGNPAIRQIASMFVRRQQHTQPDLEFGFFCHPRRSHDMGRGSLSESIRT